MIRIILILCVLMFVASCDKWTSENINTTWNIEVMTWVSDIEENDNVVENNNVTTANIEENNNVVENNNVTTANIEENNNVVVENIENNEDTSNIIVVTWGNINDIVIDGDEDISSIMEYLLN
jgi:hypothetical protein